MCITQNRTSVQLPINNRNKSISSIHGKVSRPAPTGGKGVCGWHNAEDSLSVCWMWETTLNSEADYLSSFRLGVELRASNGQVSGRTWHGSGRVCSECRNWKTKARTRNIGQNHDTDNMLIQGALSETTSTWMTIHPSIISTAFTPKGHRGAGAYPSCH